MTMFQENNFPVVPDFINLNQLVMKYTILLYFATCYLTISSVNLKAQTVPDIKNGLLVYYQLNGNTKDSSGLNKHAKTTGTSFIPDKMGNPARALILGKGDKLEIPAPSSPIKSFTFNIWYKTTDTAFAFLSGYNPGTKNELYIGVADKGSKLSVGYHDSTGENLSSYTGIPIDGIWHMLTVQASEDFTRIFIDAKPTDAEDIGTEAGLSIKNLIAGAKQQCAASCWDESKYFEGSLDELRIYNRVLTEPEIALLFEDIKDITAPKITISAPLVTRGLKIIERDRSLQTVVSGKITEDGSLKKVWVNNIPVQVNADGNFSLPIELQKNVFVVTAEDAAGNKTVEQFSVDEQNFTKPDTLKTVKQTGKYYAIIIGVEDYNDPNINDLENPVKDSERLMNLLRTKYTFDDSNIIFLKNPKREEITKQFDLLTDKMTENDNLLIFYAGHGYWDEKLKQGYWLPSDASKGNRGTWFSNSDLKTYIGGISSKHTLLIADACFGGSIFKTRDAFSNNTFAINELNKMPSRKAMTSGAMKTVPDKSVFIEYLVKRLNDNTEKYLSTEQLFASFKTAVINNSPNGQIPQFGDIRETGDEGGDFIFVLK